ncbi:MAG: hypothetical protein AAFN93_19430 [Bacteroidota bacterium]
MRTSLIEVQEIENFLMSRGEVSNRLLTEAKIMLDEEFKDKAKWQSKTYDIVRQYGREKLRQEIKEAEQQVFNSNRYRSFQHLIVSIFKR